MTSCPVFFANLIGNKPARHARNRIFAGAVYVGHNEDVGFSKVRAVIFKKELRPRIAVRLKQADDAVRAHVAAAVRVALISVG